MEKPCITFRLFSTVFRTASMISPSAHFMSPPCFFHKNPLDSMAVVRWRKEGFEGGEFQVFRRRPSGIEENERVHHAALSRTTQDENG